MKGRIYLVAVLVCMQLCADSWTVEFPEKGTLMLKNESGTFYGPEKSVFYLSNNGIRVRKTFPLEKLPDDALKNARRAALRVYCNITDFYWGKPGTKPVLNESICFDINGHNLILKTSDPRFPKKKDVQDPQYFQWVDIDFPVSWISGEQLTVTAFKMSAGAGDDYFYPAIDITADNNASAATSNGGLIWGDLGCIKDGKGEAMMRLLLYNDGETKQGIPGSDISSDKDITKSPVILQNGALKGDEFLSFEGTKGNRAIIPGSDSLNVTDYGLTVSGVFRCREPDPDLRKDRNMMFFLKDDVFFLARTGNKFNFSICANGRKWSEALIEGELPDFNEWFHIAAVIKRENDVAQGNIGYRLMLYLNGELYRQKMLRYATIPSNKNSLILGSWGDAYDFCGDIAEVSCFNRVLCAEELSEIVKNYPLIRSTLAGTFEMPEQVTDELQSLQARASSAAGKWLVASLLRSGTTGADSDKQQQVAALSAEQLGLTASSDAELVRVFNASQGSFRLCLSEQAILLMILGSNRQTFPVAGLFNRATQTPVFADRTMEWKVYYLDENGKSATINSFDSSLAYTVVPGESLINDGSFLIEWKSSDLEGISSVNFTGARLSVDLKVKILGARRRITEICFPQWHFASLCKGKETLVYPRMSGQLARNPTSGFNYSDLYPSAEVPMQFSACYDDMGNGIYFGYEDPLAKSKNYSLASVNDSLHATWSNPVAYSADSTVLQGTVCCPEAVLELYRGKWYEAGQIYKRFLARKAFWWVNDLPRTSTPQWYRNHPMWIVASATPGAVTELTYLRKYFDLPIGTSWVWWCSSTGGDNPQHEPGRNHAKMMSDLQAADIKVNAYVNPRLWDFRPGGKGSNWRNTAGKNMAIRSIAQEPQVERYGPNRDYPIVCPAYSEAISQRSNEYGRLAGLNISGLYLDQMPCARPMMCFSKEHGHLLNDPSVWLEHGYWKMMQQAREKCRAVNPALTFDGEDASEPYLASLDGFMTWRWTQENHIPLFQSIYAGRIQFTGRSYDANCSTGSGDWDSFFQKAAEQLVYGEQIGWFHLNDLRYASPRRIFAKKMAHLRLALADFLNCSEMLAPLTFATPVPLHTSLWGTDSGVRKITLPSVLSSAWRHANTGCELFLFVNPLNKTMTVEPFLPTSANAMVYLCREGDFSPQTITPVNGGERLIFPPYSTALYLAGKPSSFMDGAAAKFSAVLGKIATFKDAGEMLEHEQNLNSKKQITVQDGRWVDVTETSWMKHCYMPQYATLGWNDEHWIQAGKDGEIFWGEIDFGKVGGRQIEIKIAADHASAGGTVEFYEITEDSKERLLGKALIPVTGDWFDFKAIAIKLSVPLEGKLCLKTRFSEKGCRIRSWRLIP